ncbi:hypothetical protein M2128_001838 [Polynucleobacter sphagniphilus]|jgi:hypothetical protein|uniref:Calcineurin-like phosphoesterase domain-containing protein n=1 Tax=Polynucleobacter sphagniphilus TaxID=1743169 RepID=A0AA43MB55_9BURK|nr:hypothetical protein [Polynucleobacter sphagniphilus]MDF9787170.1 hypothetical protein [Polynucleobacter sphagniphilus]MDH6240731.1 hypothetical protein [Polynucleobacter sphagniphilus]MDH6249816.1 hypothetical protein [Polynucleobacter sphagniphilus]MDH6302897.1 hypothetical protein [Polynucleobacter sphagniphilus]MDH6504664.1 hypothetical protein [Polynucleobacter sphagniphilus]
MNTPFFQRTAGGILLLCCIFFNSVHAQSFRFVALGDMPYTLPGDFVRYERLIGKINSENPSFSIFVGDTKSGSTPCSDEYVQKISNYFNTFQKPLIYSIGDNEWTDCHRPQAGSYDPIERLDYIRSHQFSNKLSFGKQKLVLTRQGDVMPAFTTFVENSLWVKNDFLFVSIHLPGSNNNFGRNASSDEEYKKRNAANLAWIEYAFDQAQQKKYVGIIFAFQADMFYSPDQATSRSSGYRDTLELFSSLAGSTNLPILLIHGDSHRLKIDQPLLNNQKRTLENVYRLEVMGSDQVQAVEIEINPKEANPYGFHPLLIKENIQAD